MPNDAHVAVPGRGAAAWNAWRATQDEAPDLSRAALRRLDLSGYDLSRADLRGTYCSDAVLGHGMAGGRNTTRRRICPGPACVASI